MKLTATPYAIPFIKPLISAKGLIHRREGLWIACQTDGSLYYGEAAPLPGFSAESFKETLIYFDRYKQQCISYLLNGFERKPSLDISCLIDAFESLSLLWSGSTPPSSVLFALDSILIQNWVEKTKPNDFAPVALNALISTREDVDAATRNGFKTIKMKIGVDVDRELDLLRWIKREWPDIKLRLDANEAWTVEQARIHLPYFSEFQPEYIEEPLNNIHESGQIRDTLKVTIAADESARNHSDIAHHLMNNICDVFILKPMLCNGLMKTLLSIQIALSHQKKVVITSSLDTGLARRTYALVASLYLHHETHGLATGKLLADDPWHDDHLIKDGTYYVESLFRKHGYA